MVKPEVKLNLQGISTVLKAHQSAVDSVGRGMESAAGYGFEYVSSPARYTARGFVQTNSSTGRRRQANEHVLQRVIGGRS